MQQLFEDIVKTTSIVEVSCDEKSTWKLLNAYEDFFSNSAVALRTTNKPPDERDLSVRYVELEKKHDPFDIALEHGFITKEGHPIEDVTSPLWL